MPPRRSKRTTKPSIRTSKHSEIEEIELDPIENEALDIQAPSQYFEFHDNDLKENDSKEIEDSSEPECISNPSRSEMISTSAPPSLSRKIRLLVRKVHITCELVSGRFFMENHMKNQELLALILSGLPRHILRILDPILIEEGKTLKNSVAMLATWWVNNIGLRMLPSDGQKLKLRPKSKLNELKASFFAKSAFEDDYVWLFALVCHGLGISVRVVHSLDLITTSTSQTPKKSNSKFQYYPHYWIEFYSKLDERWVSVDCARGTVDEPNRLENILKPHSFVLSVDIDGIFHDLTQKYSSVYLERSFKLRKDEDGWLKELIRKLNSEKNSLSNRLPDCQDPVDKKDAEVEIEIPKTLSGIKNHPILMLGSQLKKYEVFYPVVQPVGYFKDEAVFLRENVKKVRSKDAWLSQCARIVKVNKVILMR